MRFNTITLDANLPTTQQVNVPTNTDYKVGMKVKRNGEIQQLGPDEFTIYTGEINVIPPKQYTSDSKTCVNEVDTNLLTLKEADLSAMAGESIKYTDVYVEFSFDNGTTWSKQKPTHNSVTVRMIDRAGAANNVIAALDLRYQNKKWILQDHGVATGEVADYVAIPEAARIQILFLGSDWGSLTYPCLWRLVFLYGGQEIPITIPTDADKTNGYVTFTQASNDDASFRQLKVAIEHGYDFNDYTERITGQFPATTPDPNPSIMKVKASDLGLTGYTLKAENYKNAHRYYWRKSTPQPADLSAWSYSEYLWPQTVPYPPEQPVSPFKLTRWGDRDVYIMCPANDTTYDNEDAPPTMKGRTAKKGVYYFYITNEAGTKIVDFTTEHTFAADDYVIVSPALRFTANYYYGQCYEMTFGTPFSANFKLNVNEFKSQCGDLNVQTDPEFSTAKVEGTYADGTEFSYDFCIQ